MQKAGNTACLPQLLLRQEGKQLYGELWRNSKKTGKKLGIANETGIITNDLVEKKTDSTESDARRSRLENGCTCALEINFGQRQYGVRSKEV